MSERERGAGRGREVLDFLDHHRLSHQPEHYAFAHAYVSGGNAAMKAEVDRVTDGGVRLTEARVRQLANVDAEVGTSAALRGLMPQLDHVALRVLDLIGDTLNSTGSFSRDLVTTSTALVEAAGSDVAALVAAMVERTERAEASLADTGRRVRDLRSELHALQDEGRRDVLTGLLNRVAMEERLAATTQARKGCLALVDVDQLRRINDGYSHAVGDRLLKVVATALVKACAPHQVARWDGGTFAVVLENLDLRATAAVLGRACESVSARRMRVRENDAPLGPVTISAGVVAARGRDAVTLMNAAAVQLRRAKDRRVSVAVEERLIGVP